MRYEIFGHTGLACHVVRFKLVLPMQKKVIGHVFSVRNDTTVVKSS